MASITLKLGQVVPWPNAPGGFAQVSDLRRKKVELVYPYKNGKIARPIIRVTELAALMRRPHVDQPIPFDNPYQRGYIPKSKEYEL